MKEKNVCPKYLEVVNEAYLRYQREEIDEEGRIYIGTSINEGKLHFAAFSFFGWLCFCAF